MSNTPAEPADQKNAVNGTDYLVEPFITEDGITVPPPARPMGPRRLARYYDEVADYLRAVQGGGEDLPAAPLFMGTTGEGTSPRSSLAELSAMGTIDNRASSSADQELELGFDETRATVLEDPLAHVGEQVFGSQAQQDAATAAAPVDFASAVGEVSGDTDFVVADSFVLETAVENPQTGRQTEAETADAGSAEVAEPAAEASEQTTADLSPETAAIIARAQEKEEAKNEPAEADVLETEAPALPSEKQAATSDEAPPAQPLPAGAMSENLPAPVRAVDAQGLDLAEIDPAETTPAAGDETEPGVTDPATATGSEPVDGAVDSDSSGDLTATDAEDQAPETTEDSGEVFTAEPTAPEGEASHQENHGEAATDDTAETPAGDTAEVTEAPAAKKGGAMASVIGIVVLIALLLVVWFFFFQ